MHSLLKRSAVVGITTVVALAGAAGASAATKPHAHAKASNPWMSVNAKAKQVTVKVVADATSAAAGFNFDGFAKGQATFIVPKGWKVTLQFSNKAALPHSMAITSSKTSTKPERWGGKTVSTPNPTAGTPKGKTQTVSFTASAPGKYYLVCLVPGHVTAGMWDYFTVSASAKTPSMTAVK